MQGLIQGFKLPKMERTMLISRSEGKQIGQGHRSPDACTAKMKSRLRAPTSRKVHKICCSTFKDTVSCEPHTRTRSIADISVSETDISQI